MSLSIALLGPPVIRVGGRPLKVDTRKAVALLAYLAVEGRPARRDTLASLLWPENDPERARSLGAAGRDRVGNLFDISRMAGEYHQDYLDLLGRALLFERLLGQARVLGQVLARIAHPHAVPRFGRAHTGSSRA